MAGVVKIEQHKASVVSRGSNWIRIRIRNRNVDQSIATGKRAVLKSGWWADPELRDLGEIQEAKQVSTHSVELRIVN